MLAMCLLVVIVCVLRMLTDDPADRMMSSAEDYGGTMEHLSLSQGYSQSQQVQGMYVV